MSINNTRHYFRDYIWVEGDNQLAIDDLVLTVQWLVKLVLEILHDSSQDLIGELRTIWWRARFN